MLLEGRKGLVLGIANKRSIAWAIAKAAAGQGARLALGYANERLRDGVAKLASDLPDPLLVECDVTDDASIDRAFETVGGELGGLDFLVHAIAFAQREDLEGEFLATTREGFRVALDVSAYSLTAVARRAAPLFEGARDGGSILTMSYLGAVRAVSHYNVMGVAKAALESSVRYLAADLGPRGIRVNGVSAGPVRTLSAAGIRGFGSILEHYKEKAPLRRGLDVAEVADASLFFLSPLSRAVTGEVLFVDLGYHALGL